MLGILSLFWTSGLRQDAAHAENAEPTREEMLNLFGEIYDLIKDNYVEQTSDKQLIYDALSGMLSGLDPHTSFLTEEDLAGFNLDALGRFGGLGLRVDKHETFIRVVNPIEDTPPRRPVYKPRISSRIWTGPRWRTSRWKRPSIACAGKSAQPLR